MSRLVAWGARPGDIQIGSPADREREATRDAIRALLIATAPMVEAFTEVAREARAVAAQVGRALSPLAEIAEQADREFRRGRGIPW